MATNEQQTELQASSQSGNLATPGRDVRGARRRSSTVRRAARNVGSFNHNRSNRIRPGAPNPSLRPNDDVSVLLRHRARTRSLARIEAEQQRRASLDVNGVQANVDSPQSDPPQQWKPSIALGSSLWLEDEDLNAIEIADRKVAQTRLWVSHYQGVPYFDQVHQEAVQEREQMDETAEENTTPRSALKSTHDTAIRQRLDLLRSLLQDSHCPAAERTNISAAISGYESGAIPYSDSYTLIWAGHIVDRSPTFDSFTTDRRTRLDRYAAAHGPGWLWYEPPLSSPGGGGSVTAKKGFCLESKAAWRRGTDNMGHYRIRMGFRRRKAHVAREAPSSPFSTTTPTTTTRRRSTTTPHPHPQTQPVTPPVTIPRHLTTPTTPHHPPTIPQPNTSRAGTTLPDTDGPRIVWEMLLDSGATLPTLFEADLPKLGIDRAVYPAQSARTVNTADSVLYARVYELDVRVLGAGGEGGVHGRAERTGEGREGKEKAGLERGLEKGREKRKGDNNKKGQQKEKEEIEAAETDDDPTPLALTSTIPVLVFAGASSDLSGGDQTPDRLSGLLPFHVCYLSGAPGSFKLWMGEDRRDVLGAGRLPGLMRYGEILGDAASNSNSSNSTATDKGRKLPAAAKLKLELWRNHGLKTPERVIFEHDFPDSAGGPGGVFRDEDVGDGNVIMRGPRGTNFDNLDAKTDAVQVLRIKRKKPPARQRRESQKSARRRIE